MEIYLAVILGVLVVVSWIIYNIFMGEDRQLHEFGCQLNHIGVVITGCGSGIGYETAFQLNKLGYCVIATCRTNESCDNFNNDKNFTSNGSFAMKMDVCNLESIKNGKNKVIEWLNKDDSNIFWCIVNNAVIFNLGGFEIVPYDMMMNDFNVGLFGPINVCRTFLPLLKGRMLPTRNDNPNNGINKKANGGRIVNITSGCVMLPHKGFTRHGTCKAALSYLTHCLRSEYCNLFGIWCSEIQAGSFKTGALNKSRLNVNKIRNYYYNDDNKCKDNLTKEEIEMCQTFKIAKFDGNEESNQCDSYSKDLSPVVNDIIHAIRAKYPKRVYYPGLPSFFPSILAILPFFIKEKIAEKAIQEASLPIVIEKQN